MRVEYIAGFGPIAADVGATHSFWASVVGLQFEEVAPSYFHSATVGGAKAFALWPLSQAAEAVFGSAEWPSDRPRPQAWIELEVESPAEVGRAAQELRSAGQEILVDAHEEPWGQTTARLISPEGLLVGISYLPSFHEPAAPPPSPEHG